MPSPRPQPVQRPKAEMGGGDDSALTLDFSTYPGLKKALVESAAENFRTPELQTLFYIENGLAMFADPDKKNDA